MKKYFAFIISAILIVAVFEIVSCEKAKTTLPVSGCNSLSDTTHIHYIAVSDTDPNSIQVIVTGYCSYQSGCHEQNSINGDYTTYQGLKPRVDDGSLYRKVVVERDMPPLYSLTYLDSCQVKEFYLWIQEGGPEY